MSEEERARIARLLKRLKELKERGVFSEEEYEEKRNLLARRLAELELERKAYKSDKMRSLSLVFAAIFMVMGLIVSFMPSQIYISYPTKGIAISTVAHTTTLTGAFLKENNADLDPRYMLVIEMPAFEMYSLPSLLEGQTITWTMTSKPTGTTVYHGTTFPPETEVVTELMPVTTTITVHIWEYTFEIGGKKYQLLSDSPRFVLGYIESDQPINFYILDSENYIGFLEHKSFTPIYSAEEIVGKREIRFTPPEMSRMGRFEKLRVVFQNMGSSAASISYKLDTVWDVRVMETKEAIMQTTTTIQQISFPYMGIGIILLIVGIAVMIIYTIPPPLDLEQVGQ